MAEGRNASLQQEAAVREIAARVAEPCGLELYDIVFRRSGPRWKVQVFLNRVGGQVTLSDCEQVSRQLSRELDVIDPIQHAYDLEVSSPGIERPLRLPWHWERAVGEQVSVRWRDAAGRALTTVGKLETVDGERVRLTTGAGDSTEVELSAVLAARIHVDW